MPFEVSDAAARDIEDIVGYLQQNASPEIADRIYERFLQSFRDLAKIPLSGHRRPDLPIRGILFYAVYSYLIVYAPQTKPLQILAVLHGKRHLKRILRTRLPSDIY